MPQRANELSQMRSGVLVTQQLVGIMSLAIKHERDKFYLSANFKPEGSEFPELEGVGHGPTVEKAIKTLVPILAKYIANVLIQTLHTTQETHKELSLIANRRVLTE